MKLPSKKILLIAGILILLLFLVLLLLITQKNNTPLSQNPPGMGRTATNSLQNQNAGTSSVLPTSAPVPKMSFDSFEKTATVPDKPAGPDVLKLYNFRTGIPEAEVRALGNKLGLTQFKRNNNTVIVYNLDNTLSRGYLQFNLDTGAYSFSSYGAFPSNISTQETPNTAVWNYLTNLGLIDETVTCPVTYERKELVGVTFVECHRDWTAAGLPILNFAGLLNIPAATPLSDLKVGVSDQNMPDDISIINTSTGQDGKKRPDDYNTVTVAISQDGEILSIQSNLRQLSGSKTIPADNLMTADEAWQQLKSGNGQLSFIAPQDSPSQVNWEELFPGNQALHLNAKVTDFMLVYLEHPTQAKLLTPTYLVRGTATLPSGNTTVFIQAVPATKYQLSDISEAFRDSSYTYTQGVVAGITAVPTSEGLKLNTFQPEQPAPPASDCVPSESQLSPIVQLGTYGRVGPFTISSEGQKRAGNWFLIPDSTSSLPDINAVTAQFDALSLEGKKAELREIVKLQKEWDTASVCPLRLTGGSPTLFVYGEDGKTLRLSSGRELTYAYPPTDNKNWDAAIKGSRLLVNGKDVSSIYYEYKPVKFEKPQKGWNIAKNEITTFVKNNLSPALGLTSKEENGLVFELSHAANRISGNDLSIGLIPAEEVDQKLPLQITPLPQSLNRYHFYLSEGKGNTLENPQLAPIGRPSYMILEFGAVAD